MRACFLIPVLDAYKGGNHLPLLSVCDEVEFTILTNRMKLSYPKLPENVSVESLNARLGPYYYGISDYLFAKAILRRYPPRHEFWKQFDVIHLNQVMCPALRRLKKTGKPLIFFIHHPVTADRDVAVKYSNTRTSGCGFLSAFVWRLRYLMLIRWQRKMCSAADRIATVSDTMRRRVADDYDVPENKISIVPNGVDGNVFTPGKGNPRFAVCALGSFIHPRKGFRFLLDVYSAISGNGYAIADVGRRSSWQAEALGGIKGVTVFGTVGREKLIEILQNSSALVSTSLFEGFGLSLIEALSCGRPAFAFDAGAVGEVLRPIDEELIVPLGDTVEMVRKARNFLQLSTEKRTAMGKHYRDRVLGKYSLEEAGRKLKKLYEVSISHYQH